MSVIPYTLSLLLFAILLWRLGRQIKLGGQGRSRHALAFSGRVGAAATLAATPITEKASSRL